MSWEDLQEAVREDASKARLSPLDYIRRELGGMPQSTFTRLRRGAARLTPDQTEALARLCKRYGVEIPGNRPWNHDLSSLRLVGEDIAAGHPPPARTVTRLRGQYPESQLIRLAESDNTPEDVMRAVQYLLEE